MGDIQHTFYGRTLHFVLEDEQGEFEVLDAIRQNATQSFFYVDEARVADACDKRVKGMNRTRPVL